MKAAERQLNLAQIFFERLERVGDGGEVFVFHPDEPGRRLGGLPAFSAQGGYGVSFVANLVRTQDVLIGKRRTVDIVRDVCGRQDTGDALGPGGPADIDFDDPGMRTPRPDYRPVEKIGTRDILDKLGKTQHHLGAVRPRVALSDGIKRLFRHVFRPFLWAPGPNA